MPVVAERTRSTRQVLFEFSSYVMVQPCKFRCVYVRVGFQFNFQFQCLYCVVLCAVVYMNAFLNKQLDLQSFKITVHLAVRAYYSHCESICFCFQGKNDTILRDVDMNLKCQPLNIIRMIKIIMILIYDFCNCRNC